MMSQNLKIRYDEDTDSTYLYTMQKTFRSSVSYDATIRFLKKRILKKAAQVHPSPPVRGQRN